MRIDKLTLFQVLSYLKAFSWMRIVLLLLNVAVICRGYFNRKNSTANIQVLAWYFPQFHPFPENDQNWGKGFTDWSLVKPSPETNIFGVPVRKPSELGYYNLLDKGIREKQGQLAREYGVDGFIFYHYWLENRPVMSEVLAKRLLDGEPNIPFMMCLVNEGWQAKFYNLKTKKLGSGELLLRMLYDEPEKLFSYLLPFFQHKDYIKVEGKPVYVIYRPSDSVAFETAINRLRRLAESHGFPGLHIVQCLQHFSRGSFLHHWADAGMEFSPNVNIVDRECGSAPPDGAFKCTGNSTFFSNDVPVSEAWNENTRGSKTNQEMIITRHFRATHDIMNAGCVFNLKGQDKPVYHGGTVAWDATPRYPMKKGEPLPKQRIIPPPEFASTAEIFERVTRVRLCKTMCDANKQGFPNFYALFAWNEWGEGATLEPTQLEGRAYLEGLKKAKEGVLSGWPGGCAAECKEMKRMREFEKCHASPGCFSKFDCYGANNYILLNNEYGLDVVKGVKQSLDTGRGTFFDTLRVRLADPGYFKEASTMHRSGWPAIMRQLIERGRVVEDPRANLVLVDIVSWWFYEKKSDPLRSPWLGIVHYAGQLPDQTPRGRGLSLSMMDILPLANFQASLPFCKGLITVSPSWQPWFARLPDLQRHKIPVFVLKHPIVHPGGGDPFSIKGLIENSTKKVILLGQQYRRVATIYKLNTSYPKVWMPGVPIEWKQYLKHRIKKEMKAEEVPEGRLAEVMVYRTATPEEYDSMLKKNLIVIDLWAATANNAVTECMKLGIPMLVRRLDAIVDYLGPDYPLYFESMEELQSILNDSKRLEKLLTAAHHYLLSLDTSDLTIERFNTRIDDVLKQISLPAVAPTSIGERSFLVLAPGLTKPTELKHLMLSIKHLRKGLKETGLGFRCIIQVPDSLKSVVSAQEITKLRSWCQLKKVEGDWPTFLSQVTDPYDSHVAILRHDISLRQVDVLRLLQSMDTFGFDVVSPSVQGWVNKAMQPREGCVAHRTDFTDFLFTVFRLPTFLCLQSHLNPSINSYERGYSATLASLCQARIGILDDQMVAVFGEVGTKDLLVEGRAQMFSWIKHIMGIEGDAQVDEWLDSVTEKRPKEFPFCQVPLSSVEHLKWAAVG